MKCGYYKDEALDDMLTWVREEKGDIKSIKIAKVAIRMIDRKMAHLKKARKETIIGIVIAVLWLSCWIFLIFDAFGRMGK
mgnify:CR=1 FL=1